MRAEEEQLLAKWLEANVVHRREYENAEKVWQTFVNIRGDEIRAAMRAHVAEERKKKRKVTLGAILVAVVVILVAAGLMIVYTPALNPWDTSSLQAKIPTVTLIPYASLRGEVKEVKFPDGSVAVMDGDSSLIGRFGPIGRKVELQRGRALFMVAPDKTKSFVVTAGGLSIVAVGTRFDVNVVHDGLTVTLIEGHVVIEAKQAGTEPTMLGAGQQYIERRGQVVVRKVADVGERATAWRSGILHFEGEPLLEAVQIVNRYTQEQFVVRDPVVAALPVSGDFKTGDVAEFTAALAEQHQLAATATGKEIELGRKVQ
jgi:transmembrane sensor